MSSPHASFGTQRAQPCRLSLHTRTQRGGPALVEAGVIRSVRRPPDQGGIVCNRLRAADEIALHAIAAFGSEKRQLLPGFDAFGDDRDVEAVAEADHGADDGARLRVEAEIDDEGAIDLDLVEREGL